MNSFPQLETGSIAQFPLRRKQKWRSIINQLESRERIVLPDVGAGEIEWHLPMRDLSDSEVRKCLDLFRACQGQFGAFTFVDPFANLFGWSEDLSQSDWQLGLLHASSGATDPLGTHRGWSLFNGAQGVQALQQTRGIPGEYVATFSVWIRSETPGTVTLARDGQAATSEISPVWKRVSVSAQGSTGSTQSSFSLVVNPGQTLQVWGLQVECQPSFSQYRQTAAATGIYEETYFASDELKITNTGAGLSSCEILLTSRVVE